MKPQPDEQEAYQTFVGQPEERQCVTCGKPHNSTEFECDDCSESVTNQLGAGVAKHLPGSTIGGQVARDFRTNDQRHEDDGDRYQQMITPPLEGCRCLNCCRERVDQDVVARAEAVIRQIGRQPNSTLRPMTATEAYAERARQTRQIAAMPEPDPYISVSREMRELLEAIRDDEQGLADREVKSEEMG